MKQKIMATSSAGGTVDPSGAVEVDYGANQKFSITPDTNYHILDVLVDGASVDPIDSYTFTRVKDQHRIDVSFVHETRKEEAEFYRVFNDEMEKWIVPRRIIEVEDQKKKMAKEIALQKVKEDPFQRPPSDNEKYFPKVDNRLVGLALSGGGVRSATYALGVLQRMAKLGVLKLVDLLSTASGGGYLGASWSSLTAPDNPEDEPPFGSEEATFPFKFIDHDKDSDRQLFDRESDAVRHLRAHGNWLLPHLGLFDVWTWVALFRYVSSTAINLLLIPIPWFLGFMTLTMMIPNGFWNREYPLSSGITWLMGLGPAVLFVIFMVFVWRQPKSKKVGADKGAEIKHSLYWLQKSVLVAGVVWVLADLFVLGIAGVYILKLSLEASVSTAGGSGAILVAAVGTIYRFFMGDTQGGVATETGGTRKKVASLLVGSLGYVALAVLLIAAYYAIDSYFFIDPLTLNRNPVSNNPSLHFALTAGAFVVAIGMFRMPVWKFLNFFSMQVIYRRGLHKAYILRKVPRKEQKDMKGKTVVPRHEPFLLTQLKKEGENPPDMPYHLIVSAVNTSGDTQLERLGRRSDGLVFAHLHSGSRITGYRRTKGSPAFKNISLSQAMAISGAAISPNMGRFTTTSNAILMTLLNVRIGTWIRNPKDDQEKRLPWRPLVWFWLKELFGMASAEDRFIYLTDGGHFDNSAIYELLKRRCKYILAVDASSDINNLATVCRLARIDLGVQMDMDLKPFKPDPTSGLSQRPYVVAKIKYPPVKGDGKPEGVLVWISTTMTRGQKPDIVRYRETDPDFPFHSTIDQFFDQSQFEAYRQLGHTAARVVFTDAALGKEPTRCQFEKALDKLLEKVAIARYFGPP